MIDRYDIEADSLYAVIHKYKVEDGQYVTYEDHAAVVARLNEQVRALAAEVQSVKAAIPKSKRVEYENDNMDDVSLAEDIGFNSAVTLMNRWMPETPTTDAIMNEVRAQGADGLAAELYRVANEHVVNGRSKKDVVQCRAAAKAAEDYAARIRAGKVQL